MALETDIYKVLEQARDEIRANMQSQGVNASGRTSASMRVYAYDGGLQLIGGTNGTHQIDGGVYGSDTAPVPTLEVGRSGGGVPKGFYQIIREWSREKGLSFGSEAERSTFAYFVARKIAREGTRRNKQHVDVYSTPVKNAVASIGEVFKSHVQSALAAVVRQSVTTSNTAVHF